MLATNRLCLRRCSSSNSSRNSLLHAQRAGLPFVHSWLPANWSTAAPYGLAWHSRKVATRATDQDTKTSSSKFKESKATTASSSTNSSPDKKKEPAASTSSDEFEVDISPEQAMLFSAIGGKCTAAIFIYVLTFFLAGFADIDPYQHLNFIPSDILWGAGVGLPVALLFGAVFALPAPDFRPLAKQQPSSAPDSSPSESWSSAGTPSASSASAASAVDALPERGLSREQLKAIRQVENSEDTPQLDLSFGSEDSDAPKFQLPPDFDTFRRGLWWYSACVIKPWYPSFRDSGTQGPVFGAACLISFAQELFLRGYVGALVAGWWAGVFSGATAPDDALFWFKVLKLANADTPRWLAAATLIALQLAFSLAPARRTQRLVRDGLAAIGYGTPVPEQGGTAKVVLSSVVIGVSSSSEESSSKDKKQKAGKSSSKEGTDSDSDDDNDGPSVKVQFGLQVSPVTYEDQIVLGATTACSASIITATNLAYALTGNLAASYAAQLLIDSIITVAQQWSAEQLPVKVTIEEYIKEISIESDDDDDDDDDDDNNKSSSKKSSDGNNKKKEAGTGAANGEGRNAPEADAKKKSS